MPAKLHRRHRGPYPIAAVSRLVVLSAILESQAAPQAPGDRPPPSALDAALRELDQQPVSPSGTGSPTGDLASTRLGGVQLRLMDLSVDLLAAAGASSERDESLEVLQGGGHDPRKRGFTLQNLELSALGAVDPYFRGEVHIVYFVDPLEGESVLELEEAFLTSQALPFGLEEWGLQVEAGFFFTEFGRLNPRHPHQWEWQDHSVINARLFGPDGLRGAGFRLGWLTPLPWPSELHFGMQNANGETMASFLASEEFFAERAIGGRAFVERPVRSPRDLLYLLRWDNTWEFGDELTCKLGASGLAGPNATGPDGRSFVYGADLLVKWQPVEYQRGFPFVLWQTEILRRDYRAEANGDPDGDPTTGDATPQAWLRDQGLYSEVLVGLVRDWALGLRYEFAGGGGESVGFEHRRDDPLRNDRQRFAPLVQWQPTHFSRLRLQYNHDRAGHLPADEAHSLWLGFEFGLGQHPGHAY